MTYAQERRGPRNDDTLTIVRPDFWVQTANKQLNFLQHIFAVLKPGGRAAVVVPDNVLFETGAASAIRRRLLESCRIHALLRLPSGLFYAQGVKSNVIFFDKPRKVEIDRPAEQIWVYDLRSDKRFSLKTKPLQREDLKEFVTLFRAGFQSDVHVAGAQAASRLRSFGTAQILSTPDCRLDLAWDDPFMQQRTPGLARLEEISRLVTEDLQRALALISKPPSG